MGACKAAACPAARVQLLVVVSCACHESQPHALHRRFQPVYVPEPSVDETYQILLGLRERYEAHHKLRYTDEALDAAAKYSHQYISDR